jgi:hypothetical protein
MARPWDAAADRPWDVPHRIANGLSAGIRIGYRQHGQPDRAGQRWPEYLAGAPAAAGTGAGSPVPVR